MKAQSTNHSRESRLIIEICQTVLKPENIKTLSGILKNQIDWSYTIRVAQRNAVLPLLSWNLLNHFSGQLDEEVRQLLDQDLKQHLRNNLFLTGKLLEIVQFFRANNIEALPFKGPMLAIQAYGNPALRRYSDLDVLVKPANFEQAAKLLSENGYTPLTSVSWLKKSNWYVGRTKDIYFTDKSGTVSLELHWKLSGSHFGLPKEMNGLWDRLECVNLGGTPVSALSFNDLLIYLCLHGSRHSWERLSWICDINELIRSEKDIDWDQVIEKARQLGCERVLFLGLYLAHDFFDLEFSFADWRAIERDEVLVTITRQIRTQLFCESPVVMAIGDRYSYHLGLKENRWDKWKLHFHYFSWYARIILIPNEADKKLLHLPRLLTPLYYITRPLRLLSMFIMKWCKTELVG
jgi:hypothetical protein